MTLIFAVTSPKYALIVADARLSAGEKIVDDDSTKVGVLDCQDATALYAYTGLASIPGRFTARCWIQETFLACAPPDYSFPQILERFVVAANAKFSSLGFRRISARQRRLSIVLTGFQYDGVPIAGLISNFESFSGTVEPHAREFRSYGLSATNPDQGAVIAVHGNFDALKIDQTQSLMKLVTDGRPPQAVRDKCEALIHDLAGDPKSSGTIGRTILGGTLTLNARGRPLAEAYYSSDVPRSHRRMLAHVSAQRHQSMAISDIVLNFLGAPTPGKQPRNSKCACGSGLKYKSCCLRRS